MQATQPHLKKQLSNMETVRIFSVWEDNQRCTPDDPQPPRRQTRGAGENRPIAEERAPSAAQRPASDGQQPAAPSRKTKPWWLALGRNATLAGCAASRSLSTDHVLCLDLCSYARCNNREPTITNHPSSSPCHQASASGSQGGDGKVPAWFRAGLGSQCLCPPAAKCGQL